MGSAALGTGRMWHSQPRGCQGDICGVKACVQTVRIPDIFSSGAPRSQETLSERDPSSSGCPVWGACGAPGVCWMPKCSPRKNLPMESVQTWILQPHPSKQ